MNPEYQDQYEVQKALMEQQSEEQQKMYLPQLKQQIEEQQAAVISQTDPEKDIVNLLMEFRGFEKDEYGEFKQTRNPIMNEVGIRRVSQILRPLMINTVRFTRLKNSTIKNFTFQIVDDLTYDIGENWREYDIKDRSACDHIINAVGILVFSMLSRAEDQNEKNWAGRIVFENLSPAKLNKKDSSWLDKFKL